MPASIGWSLRRLGGLATAAARLDPPAHLEDNRNCVLLPTCAQLPHRLRAKLRLRPSRRRSAARDGCHRRGAGLILVLAGGRLPEVLGAAVGGGRWLQLACSSDRCCSRLALAAWPWPCRVVVPALRLLASSLPASSLYGQPAAAGLYGLLPLLLVPVCWPPFFRSACRRRDGDCRWPGCGCGRPWAQLERRSPRDSSVCQSLVLAVLARSGACCAAALLLLQLPRVWCGWPGVPWHLGAGAYCWFRWRRRY